MENKNSLTIKWIATAIIVASVIISGTILYTNSNGGLTNNNGNSGQAPSPSAPTIDASKIKTEGVPFIGNANAPVIVAEWYDYQCPFCKRFNDTMDQVITEYVNTGKVKILFKDYQFLGQDSQIAGLASRAVWEVAPDKFYQFHSAMFDKQDDENGGWGKKEDILDLIQSLGIDSAKVNQLMTSKAQEYQKLIDDDKSEGSSFGINGTPGTIIGGQLLSGAQPYESVKQLIEIALQEK